MKRRRGFTLIELVVAVAITGLVLLLAHRTFSAAADGVLELRVARAAADRRGNAHDLLRDAFLGLDVGQQGDVQFEGHEDRARFSTWLLTSDGWSERADLRLELVGTALVARVSDSAAVVLQDSVTALAFDYLLQPGAESRWATEWISPVSAPLAVRLRVTAHARTDTALYLVKARG